MKITSNSRCASVVSFFTQDEDFLALAARPTSRNWGIIFNKFGTKTIGETLEFLELFHGCMSDDEMENHLEYF